MRRNGNHSWKAFSVLLTFINLPLVWIIIYGLIANWPYQIEYILAGIIVFITYASPFLLPLALIDIIALGSFTKKQPPPWKLFLIMLLVFNAVFFLFGIWIFTAPEGGTPAAIFVLLIAVLLLLFDFCAIYIALPHRKAKVIFYATVVSIAVIFLALSLVYFA